MALELLQQIDVRTVMICSAVITLLLALCLGFGLLRGQHGPVRRATFLWLAATAVQPAGWLLLSQRGAWSDLLSSILANALLMGAYATYVRALRTFNGHRGKTVLPYALAALGVSMVFVFTYVWPSVQWRVVGISPFTACILALAASAATDGPVRATGVNQRMTALVFIAGALVFGARAVYEGLLGPALTSLLAATPMQVTVFTYAALMPVIASFGFVLMSNERNRADLERQAATDGLTGVFNRRMLEQLVHAQLAEARRHLRPLTLLLIDADHFKAINDEYGHDAGDHALRAIVRAIRPQLRPSDLIGRLGGEEFLVVLAATPQLEAVAVAERLRSTIEAHPVLLRTQRVVITVSIGVATQSEDDTFAALVRRADTAMYEAKRAGRNCVSIAR